MDTHSDKVNWGRAKTFIPSGVQTVSKHPDRFTENYPIFIKSGDGCFLEDMSGKVYTDYICSLGPIILGHNNKTVNDNVKAQIDRGSLYSFSSTVESGVAQSLNYHIPCAEKAKFFKTGSDVTSAAIRVARAVTGKERILVCGYHGWHDWYAVCQKGNKGIPRRLAELVNKFEYNNIESLRVLFHTDDVAAVIMEPVKHEEPKEGFLQEVQDMCKQHGSLLIFDEIITGFRLHLGGAQKLLGVVPDLACFSKAMGNGYPIGALVGKKAYMDIWDDGEFFVSGTFGGDLVGLTAAKWTMKELEFNNNCKFNQIYKSGTELQRGFNYIASELGLSCSCVGYPQMTKFVFPSVEHRGAFMQEMCERNVLMGPINFINACHSSLIIQTTLSRVEEVLTMMRDCWDNPTFILKGRPPFEVVLR